MANYFILIVSLLSLIWASRQLVDGALGLSHHYRIPPLFLGLTVIALGSSAPEIMMAISAGLLGHTDLVISNAVGANLANIGLVLGIAALLQPYQSKRSFLKKEYPLLFVVMLFMYLLVIDGELSAIDGLLLLVGFIILLSYLFFATSESTILQLKPQVTTSKWSSAFMLIIGIIVMAIGAKYLIRSSIGIATHLGLSEVIISYTIVAITTSMPELITSIVAIARGQNDIAVGNILGSNLFNLLSVLTCPWILHPAPVSGLLLWRDIPAMLFISALLFAINRQRPSTMNRWHGGLLILIYVSYILALILNAAI